MHRRTTLFFAAAALTGAAAAVSAAPPPPVPGGEIGTLEIGRYVCELPGNAIGEAGRRVAAADFAVLGGSSYRAEGGNGTYLKVGDRAILTSGPRKGEIYHQISRNFLRRVGPDGADSDIRCVRASRHRG